MLEYLIPEGTDTADARRLLTAKGEADLRKQGATLFETLKRINAQCKVTNDKGEETGFDYQASDELSGADSDRNAQLMRMTAERKAIREELRERSDRAAIRHEIESPLPDTGNAYTDGDAAAGAGATGAAQVGTSISLPPHLAMEMFIESICGNHVQALLDQSGAGAGFDPVKGARPFLETHKSLTIPGMTLDAALGASFGHPRAATMTQTGTGAGYKPFSYRDLREALMTSQINSYTGMLQRRSTEGQIKINYLQESAQSLSADVVRTGTPAGNAEAPTAEFAESDFTVTEQSVDLRKIATKMHFSVEELRSRSDFVGFLTTRIVRAVANKLEQQLIAGDNNKTNSGQLHGLGAYEAGAALSENDFHGIGVDNIEAKISSIEDVNGQMATSILMEHTSITAVRTWHVNVPGGTGGATADRRYIIGDPNQRGPLMLWDVPVVKVPVLTAKDVYVLDTMPIVCYDRGEDMNVRFSDSHASNFTKDVWTAVCTFWANVAYTRHVPASGMLAHKYVERITGFENVKS